MTVDPIERTPDLFVELLPELVGWGGNSREVMLRVLVAYAQEQYRAAGEPEGASLDGPLRWLTQELMQQ
jgi:hypothetical protein